MPLTSSLLQSYNTFAAQEISDRFFKHSDLLYITEKLKSNNLFHIEEVGQSFQGRPINLITCGIGEIKIFLWSQMHGNEATATMALMDLFNFLGADTDNTLKDIILKNCRLYILPMVNPDGAEVFNRRNAQEIDINRDFNGQQSPEGRLLRGLRDKINPHFGFNLHDQTTMWSAGISGNPATISFLAPAYNDELSVNTVRKNAMQVIAEMNDMLQSIIPGHVGRFDDEYEPRAFGDNFQAAGTSTILIEAGGYADDPEKQHIRKLVFLAIIEGLRSISARSFVNNRLEDYFEIPENKLNHFQILLRNCKVRAEGLNLNDHTSEPIPEYTLDIGLIAKETISDDLRSMNYTYLVEDVGDLSNKFGYKDIDCGPYTLIQTQSLKLEAAADIVLMNGVEVLLAIENGVVTNSTI